MVKNLQIKIHGPTQRNQSKLLTRNANYTYTKEKVSLNFDFEDLYEKKCWVFQQVNTKTDIIVLQAAYQICWVHTVLVNFKLWNFSLRSSGYQEYAEIPNLLSKRIGKLLDKADTSQYRLRDRNSRYSITPAADWHTKTPMVMSWKCSDNILGLVIALITTNNRLGLVIAFITTNNRLGLVIAFITTNNRLGLVIAFITTNNRLSLVIAFISTNNRLVLVIAFITINKRLVLVIAFNQLTIN